MKYLPFAFAPLALAISFAAQAADDEKPLNEIVVTASRSAQTAGIDTAYVQVITREDIKNSGAETVLDVLRRAAVIQIVDLTGDGSSPTIGMRGFGSNGSQNTLVLLDGRRFNNETDLGTVNLRNLSIGDIERIEIVNGSSGALYGAGAVGGIVNIITKRADGNQLNLRVSRGSYDTEKYKARATALKGAWRMVLNGDKELSDNYRDNNALNSSFGQVKLAYDDNQKTGFVEVSKLKQTNGLAGSLNDAQLAQNRRQANTPFNNSSVDGTRVSTGGSIQLNDDWLFSVDSSVRSDDITAFFSPNPAFSQKRDQLTVSPRLQGKINLGKYATKIILGQDIERGRYEAFGSIGKPKTNSSYIQLSLPVSNTVEVTTGYRYGRHQNDISLTPKVKDSVSAASLGVFWKASDSVKTWFRADQNFRFATIDETTFTSGSTLKTQTGTSYEAGAEKTYKQHTVKAQLYQLNLKNEITYDANAIGPSSPFGFNGANINLDPTQRRGLSASWDTKLSPKLDAGIQLGLVNGKFTAGSANGKYIPNVPRTSLTGALTYRPIDKTTVALETQFTGSKFADSDVANNSKVKSVLVHNLAVSQQWKEVTLSIRVNNVLNERYDLYTNDSGSGQSHSPAAERNALLTLAYSLK